MRIRSHFPLLYQTPASWADRVLTDPIALLNDHAYLERKAASNALELLNRWSQSSDSAFWMLSLSQIARDETAHLNSVLRLLVQRGGTLIGLHQNLYAGDLRKLVRKGKGNQELLDRLLIAALIEVRSCERFEILAAHSSDGELVQLYQSLHQSEMSHYKIFLKLGASLVPSEDVPTRWQYMLEAEAEIIQKQPPHPKIHSS